jgi:hypothetical protein
VGFVPDFVAALAGAMEPIVPNAEADDPRKGRAQQTHAVALGLGRPLARTTFPDPILPGKTNRRIHTNMYKRVFRKFL